MNKMPISRIAVFVLLYPIPDYMPNIIDGAAQLFSRFNNAWYETPIGFCNLRFYGHR